MKKILPVLFLVGTVLGIQMAAINRPYAGHFASYQATVMASMARNMATESFSDLLNPKTDVLIAGKKALHLNQYPFPSVIAGAGFKFVGGSMEFWGRFQAVIFNLVSILLVGLCGAILFGSAAGWVAAFIFAFSPYTLIYGQAMMSESMSLAFFLAAFYFLIRRQNLSINSCILSGFLLSIAIAGRVHFVIFIPVFMAAVWWGNTQNRFSRLIFFGLTAMALPAAWYGYTWYKSHQVLNVHTTMFMQLGGGGEKEKMGLEFLLRSFNIVFQRLLTPVVFPFVVAGIFMAPTKGKPLLVFLGFALGFLLFVLTPEKIIKHDFYLYAWQPFLVWLAAAAVSQIASRKPALASPKILTAALMLYLAVSTRYFFNPIFLAPAEEKKIPALGAEIQKLTQPGDKIVLAGENPALLIYYANRPCWTLQFNLLGKPLSGYRKSAMAKVDYAEIEREEVAMKEPISWFQYLYDQGASYLIIQEKAESIYSQALTDYLDAWFQLISDPSAPYAIYRLTPAA